MLHPPQVIYDELSNVHRQCICHAWSVLKYRLSFYARQHAAEDSLPLAVQVHRQWEIQPQCLQVIGLNGHLIESFP